MTDSFQRLALLALAIISWALADQIGGNGFIAAFVGGLAVGPTVERVGRAMIQFTEAEGQLLNLSVFFIFGVLVIRMIQPLSWEVAPVCPPQPHRDPHAAGGAFPDGDAPARRLGAVCGLVRPSGARLDSAGPDRGGGGSPARRARRDRAGGGADGAARACSCTGSLPLRSPPCTPAGSRGWPRTCRRSKKRSSCRPAWALRRPVFRGTREPDEIQMEGARHMRS